MAREILEVSDRKFSYSASNVLKTCEKQFVFKYQLGVEQDTDVDDDAAALRFGKAFHTVMEVTNHDASKFKMEYLTKAAFDNNLNTEESAKLYACVKSYYELHSKSKLECVAIEMEIGDENIVGYVDAVMADKNGNWYIVDLKTSGLVMEQLFARLHKDSQLGLYSAFAQQIVNKINATSERKLEMSGFLGCRYRVVAKPRTTVKTGEAFESYATRANPEAYDVFIPIARMCPQEALTDLLEAKKKAESLTLDTAKRNRAMCIQWNRACPYWSQCHGDTFTACKDSAIVFTRANMCDQTKG